MWNFLSVVHPLQIPIPMSKKKNGFNKKSRTTLLIVYMYFQPNSCNTHAEGEWAQGTFLRQRRNVFSAHAQRVYLEERSDEGSPHWMNFSVCLSVRPSV